MVDEPGASAKPEQKTTISLDTRTPAKENKRTYFISINSIGAPAQRDYVRTYTVYQCGPFRNRGPCLDNSVANAADVEKMSAQRVCLPEYVV